MTPVETLALNGATAGTTTFTLTFDGVNTASEGAQGTITYTGTAADATKIQTALNALSTIDGGADAGGTATVVQVSPGVWAITLGGSLVGFNNAVTGTATGAATFSEAQTITLTNPSPGATKFTLSFNGVSTVTEGAAGTITYTGTVADDAAIQTALDGLLTIGGVERVGVRDPELRAFTMSASAVPWPATVNRSSAPRLPRDRGRLSSPLGWWAAAGPWSPTTPPCNWPAASPSPASPSSWWATAAATSGVPTQWFQVGPAPISNGQTPGNLTVGGRVTAVAVDTTDTNVIYISTGDGGAWKSIDDGTTWRPIFDALPNTQTILDEATAGTFTLTFNGQTTVALAFNATAAAVQTALNNLSTIGGLLPVPGSVTVTLSGTIYTITFGGSLTGVSVPPITATASAVAGSVIVNPQTQVITDNLSSGTFALTYNGQTTGNLAFDVQPTGGVGATASVQNALDALSSIGGVGGFVTVTEAGAVNPPGVVVPVTAPRPAMCTRLPLGEASPG